MSGEFEQAEIVAELRFPGVSRIHGVSFDGSEVWIVDGGGGRLARIDTRTGRIDHAVSGTDLDAGIAFDGSHLWQVGTNALRRLDPESGAAVRALAFPAGDDSIAGLAFGHGSLWVGSYIGRKIYEIDPASGEVRRTLHSDRYVTGITWHGDELWHGAISPTYAEERKPRSELRRIDPRTGEVLRRLRLPDDSFCSGMETDAEGRIWYGDPLTGALRAVRLGPSA